MFNFYDKILHLLIPFGLCYIMSRILKTNNVTHYGFVAVFIILGFGTIHELGEFYIDKFSDNPIMQGVYEREDYTRVMSPIDDTMYDLTLGLIGSFLGMFSYKIKNRFERYTIEG